MNYRPALNIPPVVKNLIIINVLFLLATWVVKRLGIDLVEIMGMHYPGSDKFMLHQIFTHMFMHDPNGIFHIFFNMFALWMFGLELENMWGSKKFLFYYMLCGVGAGLANLFIAPFFSTVAPTIGASGSVYGVLVAFGYLFPNRYIYIYFMLSLIHI